MIEDIEFDTEWPGRTVLAESLETIDKGLGMMDTSSEKPTLVFLIAFGLGSAFGNSGIDLADCSASFNDPTPGG